jgi:NAD-dependent dihydropyrimidine dehydrogenase PreA subunit
MAYVITDACTKDFVCAAECTAVAISPVEGDAKADSVSQLYINPDECLDCGNCVAVCESNAIFALDELPADKADFADKNKAFFK